MEQIKEFFGKLFSGLWENKGGLGGAAGGMMLANMLFPEGGILTSIIGMALGGLLGGTLMDDGDGFVNRLLHRKQGGAGHGHSYGQQYGQMQILGKEGGLETHALEKGISVVGRDQFKTLSTAGEGEFEKNGEFKVYKAKFALENGGVREVNLERPVTLKMDEVGNLIKNDAFESLTEQLKKAQVTVEQQAAAQPKQKTPEQRTTNTTKQVDTEAMFRGMDNDQLAAIAAGHHHSAGEHLRAPSTPPKATPVNDHQGPTGNRGRMGHPAGK
jgi:hypothetical protein